MFLRRLWGEFPPGFVSFTSNGREMVLVRKGLEGILDSAKLLARGGQETETAPFRGRGKLALVRLADGESVVVRSYRHGGLLRCVTGRWFFTWPPRPFRELAVTEEVGRRGLPTLQVLAARVERSWGPFYRGWLITKELKGALDLWEALQRLQPAGRDTRGLLRAVARSLARMHSLGIYHRDLNLKNIMVRGEGEQAEAFVIDFDKAKLYPGPVPPSKAQKNLRRLLRSICKLDPGRRFFSQDDWSLLTRHYGEEAAG